MEKNLTGGSVLKNIIVFSLPYFLSYFLQTLYGMADLYIIGQFEGVASTTAVSIGSQVMHMLTVMIVGLAMGTTVFVAQSVGAQDKKEAAKGIGNTASLFLAVSILLTAILILLARPITKIISTPSEAVGGTVAYLTICFAGIPFITAYNVISAIFRGMGDSKSPMYFIAIACAANIALDYLFMGAFHLGPAGAALGTTLSQAVSVAVSLFVILRRKSGIKVTKKDFRPEKSVMKTILKNRSSGGVPGRTDSSFVHHHHNHREQARTQRLGGGRNRRKNHEFPLSVPVVNAFHSLGAWRAEHRRGKTRARNPNFA